jgi:acetolactate synthase-1/2/3 large subunit
MINAYTFIEALSNVAPDDAVIVPTSSGTASEITFATWYPKPGQRMIFGPTFGAMGCAIPHAIGACIASGRKQTICIDGDGSFMMNIQELEVVRRLALPIAFFIFDNLGYRSIRATQDRFFDGRHVGADEGSGLTLPDILEVAKGFKITTMRIINPLQLKWNLERILSTSGPVVCAVNIDPNQVTIRPEGYYK